jgi:ribosomal protein S18 acetylase RimI-like enzyme
MTPSGRTRLATLSDVDVLVRLMRDFYAESAFVLHERPAARTFAALLEDPRFGQVWMMEYDDRPAGFVVLTVGFSMEYGGLRGFVDDFYVAAPYRNRGLGHAALEEVKRACRNRGVRALLVEVSPDNEAALSAYRSVGFADMGHSLLKLELAPAVHDLLE